MAKYEAQTPRLFLQRLTLADHLEDFQEMWSDPLALVWSTQGPKTTIEEARAWMLKQLPVSEGGEEDGIDKFVFPSSLPPFLPSSLPPFLPSSLSSINKKRKEN
jgi:hypothetical protein